MKTMIVILFTYLAIVFSTSALASVCSQGGCGGGSECDYNQSSCQCTDPMCNRPWYSDCSSRATCCEAFGNIGAR